MQIQTFTEPPALLRTITDLLIAFTDHYKTSQTITDPLIDFTDRYKTSSTHNKTSSTRYKLLPPAISPS